MLFCRGHAPCTRKTSLIRRILAHETPICSDEISAQQARWLDRLVPCVFLTHHTKRKRNNIAIGLSRRDTQFYVDRKRPTELLQNLKSKVFQ